MLTRDYLNPLPTYSVGEYAERLTDAEVRELQDTHSVNLTSDHDDTWLDSDPIPSDADLTVMEELEFWAQYGDD